MKKIIFTFLASSLIAFSGNTQETEAVQCGMNEMLELLHKQHPELKAEHELNKELLKNSRVKGESSERGVTYVVPVVVHILHEYGSENYSDANVYSMMNNLNESYNAANSGLSQISPAFDTIIGDIEIEFKLAAIDPLGNCTNGIEHINNHNTRFGDAASKLNQWNRAKYYNIWIVSFIAGENSAAPGGGIGGYSIYPSGTDGLGYRFDGAMLAGPNSGTLIHETGHWLALPHPFGTNGVSQDGICGDDGISDTPPTDGGGPCNLTNDFCETGVFENVQNVMDYTSCGIMFTDDQANVMRNSMIGISGERNRLWNDTTLIETGVKDLLLPQDPNNSLTVPLCAPVADFSVSSKITCVGEFVSFKDASWNAVVDNRTWTFQDGSPATSTSLNPTISFSTPGLKTVTLTSSNDAGSGTETRTSYIFVNPEWASYEGPHSFNLENNEAEGFIVNNPEDNYARFHIVNDGGYDNSRAFKLNNYKNVENALLYTDDYFYNDRLGGNKDELVTPSFDLRYTSGITFSFDYSYATNTLNESEINEEIKVYSSKNCGVTWILRKTITPTQIVTAGFAGSTDFKPTQNSQWANGSFVYNATSQDDKTMFKFVFIATDLSSNLYLDNINIQGTLSLTSDLISNMDLNVFPNPSNGEEIQVSYNGQDEDVTFKLRDAQGKVIATQLIASTNGVVTQKLNKTANLPAAMYFLEIQTGDYTTTKKVVVL